MSGICSAHPQHEPGCPQCESPGSRWLEVARATTRQQDLEDMLRMLATIYGLDYDPDQAIRDHLRRIETTIADCEALLPVVAGARRVQIEDVLARCRERREQVVWLLTRQLKQRLGTSAPPGEPAPEPLAKPAGPAVSA